MRTVIYSLAFIAMFYLAGMACELAGMEDNARTGIYILIAVFAVLGLYIRGRNSED